MSNFKDLQVWQKAHALSLDVMRTVESRKAPKHTELRRQLVRSGLSIESCIAEGSGKHSDKEFVRFLRMSTGSCNELEAQLITSTDIRFIRSAESVRLIDQVVEVRKMLFGLIRYLERRSSS